ncbi:MAG: alkaline phosphatase family protein [Armatimonadota bacterium]|nr:alkaline phosphatase family protein [Armatimonadota bacterium]
MLRWFRRGPQRKLVIIGLDGVPHSLLTELMEAGEMPTLAQMAGCGDLRPARSTQPTVSCAAWTSFVTGVNPGVHGVFGFVDRRPGSYQQYITGAPHVKSPQLWRMVGERDHRVIIMNVPVTSPPPEVNGLLVGGFLAPKLEGATHPPELATRLERLGYRIDIDPWQARQSLDLLLEDLDATLAGRVAGATELLSRERWSLAMVHIMGTDRINHFLWAKWDDKDPQYAPRFVEYYSKVDAAVAQIAEAAGDDAELLLLSDHGFTRTVHEINLDVWLRERGYLSVPVSEEAGIGDVDERTRVFSMTPGRIYVNLRGREPQGSVEPGEEYDALRAEVAAELMELTDPDSGQPVLQSVQPREKLFSGAALEQAPDLLAIPRDGYDLKSALGGEELFTSSPITGMHTFDDAFWLIRGRQFADGTPRVEDGAPTALALLEEEIPGHIEGRPMA